MKNTIEINSLSLQGSSLERPQDILIPSFVTEKMLENADSGIKLLEGSFPQEAVGISLHTGAVIDLEKVRNSNIPVTSIDVPDIGYPSEFLAKVVSRPSHFLSHIAWRLNSTLGVTKSNAQSNRLDRVSESAQLFPFNDVPFLKISLENSDRDLEKFLDNIPEKWKIGIEYSAESGMNVATYVEYIKNLRKKNENIGLSLDLAHWFEYYKLNETLQPQEAVIAVNNFYENVLRDFTLKDSIFSLDINNVEKGVKEFGDTHKLFSSSRALNIGNIVERYQKYVKEFGKDGRLCLEFSPKEFRIFCDGNGAYLLSELEAFSK